MKTPLSFLRKSLEGLRRSRVITGRSAGLVLRATFAQSTRNGSTTTVRGPLRFLGIFLVLSFLAFPVKGGESFSPASGRFSSPQHLNLPVRLCLSECSSQDSTVSLTSYSTAEVFTPTFCDPQVQYRNQPAECQTAANSRREVLYLVILGSLLVGLLSTLLAFLLIRL